jgi:hypothetical protein
MQLAKEIVRCGPDARLQRSTVVSAIAVVNANSHSYTSLLLHSVNTGLQRAERTGGRHGQLWHTTGAPASRDARCTRSDNGCAPVTVHYGRHVQGCSQQELRCERCSVFYSWRC